jgi:putative addiction module killer protein
VAEVLAYTDALGRNPYEEWFDGLSAEAAAKVVTATTRLSGGNFSNVRPVGSGVSERVINFGQGYRVYFGQDGPNIILLLAGGTKKRQQDDINLAIARWQDYKRRKGRS